MGVTIRILWGSTAAAAGKWARRLVPFVATSFLLVLTANLIKLVPGFESIGYLEQAHGTIKGYAPVALFGSVYALDGSHPVDNAEAEGGAAGEGEHGLCTACEVVPFLRGSA